MLRYLNNGKTGCRRSAAGVVETHIYRNAASERENIMEKNAGSPNAVLGKGCQGKLEVPTEKEREALAAMKSIKERVRALKKHLTALKASKNDETTGEILELEKELVHLKVDWDKWEKRRQEAAKERMILLGHEKD